MQHLVVTFAIFTIFTDLSISESTKEPAHDLLSRTTLNDLPLKEITGIREKGLEKKLPSKKMWIHNPIEHSAFMHDNLNQVLYNKRVQPMPLRAPHSITKLAKTLSYGFDPYFSKGSFEPFETRPKPITLVAFRKNGLAPREIMKHDRIVSGEAAELQSPFNPISSFWSDSGFDS